MKYNEILLFKSEQTINRFRTQYENNCIFFKRNMNFIVKDALETKGNYCRHRKSVRKFGKDLTNIVGNQAVKKQTFLQNLSCLEINSKSKKNLNKTKAPKSVLLISELPSTKFSSRRSSLETKQSSSRSGRQVRASSFLQKHITPPLETHREDISQYLVDQSFVYRITEDYICWQTEIDIYLREQLMSFLIQGQKEFNLSQQTLFLAGYLIDRYCYLKNIVKKKYDLLGATCLMIAAKFHQKYVHRINRYMGLCKYYYTLEEHIEMEGEVLNTIMFEINQAVLPRQLVQIRIEEMYQKNILTDFRESIMQTCEYILELCLLEYEFCRAKPNYLSAVVLFYSIKLIYAGKSIECHEGIRSKKIIETYELSEGLFKQYFHKVLNLFKKRRDPKFAAINSKYGINFD